MAVEYQEKAVSSLLFNTTPSLIKSISHRITETYYPRGPRSGYKTGESVEFDMVCDQCVDLQSFSLQFKLIVEGTTPNNARISNAADVIKKIEVFYNDVVLSEPQDVNVWHNAFLFHNANESWMKTDGQIYMGLNNQFVTHDVQANARVLSVPLNLVAPIFAINNYLPIMGNKLRVRITLAPVNEVISKKGHADNVYRLDEIVIQGDTVVLKTDYRNEIIDAMKSEKGFMISYVDYSTHKHSAVASTNQYIRQNWNLSNALSLHLLHSPDAAKNNDAAVLLKHRLWCQSFPLNNFKNLKVKSGSVYYTPVNGLSNYQELFQACEKTMGIVGSLDGIGVLNYDRFVLENYVTDNDPFAPAAEYGHTLLSCNLEKVLQADADDAILNSGISSQANGSSHIFDIDLETTSALLATSTFYLNIVHRKTLKFSNSTWEVLQ